MDIYFDVDIAVYISFRILFFRMLPSTTSGARLLVRNVLPCMFLSRLESTGKVEYGLEKKWAYYNQQAIDKEASRVSSGYA